MSQQKKCPFCNRTIRMRDKYCPYCGRYVMETPPPQSPYSRVTPVSSTPHHVPPNYPQHPPHPQSSTIVPPQTTPPSVAEVPQPPPTESVSPTPPEEETLSDEVIDQIALRVELEQLDLSLKEIRGKIEELGELISKIEVTEEVEQRIQEFKNKIKEIKTKRENLNAEKRPLPFEADLTKKKEIQERLKNLNEAYRSKKVTETAFKKLRAEYEQQLQEIDQKSRSFKAKINTWIKKLKADKAGIEEQLELLEARYAAGELKEDSFAEQKKTFEEKLKRYNNTLKYLSAQL
ncbi:MAG: hypothetical protein ACTSRS_00755 [Candidatus Helarchaeota archaeon]